MYRGRPPLSHLLRPTRPPEERGRGDSGEKETLKGLFTQESWGWGK
jgi:hypothetical protein